MDKRSFHVGITGSYGGLNLGDEAILESILSQLRQSVDAKITVFSRNPDDTRKRHPADQVIAVREASRDEVLPVIKSLDLLIFGGGGILFDAEVKVFLREVQLAQEAGVPVIVYAVSAGPLKDSLHQALVRDCLNRAAVVTVRDRKAQQLLEEIGVRRKIAVTADPAFLLKAEPFPEEALVKEGIDGKKALIGMSVREAGLAAPDLDEAKYHMMLANVADFMIERFEADVVFVPMERERQDMQQAHAVVAQMFCPQRAHVLKGDYRSGQIAGLMRYFEFAVGMRLHFLIFAAMQNVPFVALPYAAKVHGLLDAFGIEMPPIQLVNAGRLIAHIDRVWDHRQSLKSKIKRRLPEIKGSARQTHQLAVQLLKHGGEPEPSYAAAATAGKAKGHYPAA